MSNCRFLILPILAMFLSAAAAEEPQRKTPDGKQVAARPQDVASLQKEYQQATNDAAQQYVRTVRRARTRYIKQLDDAMRAATRRGDLENALALRAEKHKHQRLQNVIPNPLSAAPPEMRIKQNLRVEPAAAIPASSQTLTARPWYVFHRTGQSRPEKVLKLEPGGAIRFLEGADQTNWDDNRAAWSYENGFLVLKGKRGLIARFKAVNTVIFRSREEDPHRFFWIQQDIADPFRPAPAARTIRK